MSYLYGCNSRNVDLFNARRHPRILVIYANCMQTFIISGRANLHTVDENWTLSDWNAHTFLSSSIYRSLLHINNANESAGALIYAYLHFSFSFFFFIFLFFLQCLTNKILHVDFAIFILHLSRFINIVMHDYSWFRFRKHNVHR